MEFENDQITKTCSRKRFSEKQAEQWWQEHRARVYEQYNVRVIDKSTSSITNDQSSH
jgi:Transcription factor regulating root and shoot growth via Pin3